MIASRKHNFIFIKTMKTAGTSIELALGPYCGPDDVLSPISARHDIERFADSGVMARNFGPPEIEKHYRKLLRKGNKKLLKEMLRNTREQRLLAHAKPLDVKAKVGDFWETAFRFTVERHPYEKAVSLAAMIGTDIETVVHTENRYIGYPWYTDERGQIVVDRVMIFDRLHEDFGEVLTGLGLPGIALPHARKTDRDRAPAREQLTQAQKAFIYEQCAPEFELFGWER